MTAKAKDDSGHRPGLWFSAGFALAIGFFVFLRTVNYSLDYSLVPEGGWVGWGLGVALGFLFALLNWNNLDKVKTNSKPVTLDVTGTFLIIAVACFAFSAPAVIARWTEGDYRLIVMAVSLLAVGWVGVSLSKSRWIENIYPTWLLVLNLLFTLSLASILLVHRVSFPHRPDSPAVVVGAPTWLQQLPLVLLLLFFPVIFLDLHVFYDRISDAKTTPRDLIPGMLLGSFTLVLLVFMYIFTNVWGYVEPVSPWFRNKFWLPYLLIAGLLTLFVGRKGTSTLYDQLKPNGVFSLGHFSGNCGECPVYHPNPDF